MPLPSAGSITLGQIADEFKVARSNVKLSQFYRKTSGNLGPVAGVVKNITRNASIPTSGAISLSQFRNAAYYYLQVQFNLTSETTSTYGRNNNGTIRVYVWGVSNNYSVTCGSTQNLGSNGASAYFTGLDATSYTVTVKDLTNGTSYAFTANISYGGTSTMTGYSTGTVLNIG